jgi:hypothetical protein
MVQPISINPSASLSDNNFVYIKQNAEGSASVTYVFGFGGYSTKALIGEAKENLMKENQLKENQTFANVTCDIKVSTVLGIVITKKCYITADIVEFK